MVVDLVPCVQVNKDTDLARLAMAHPWINATKLVCKADDLIIGQRKAYDLALIDATLEDVVKFIDATSKRSVTVNSVTGIVSNFLVEPFVPHRREDEFYLSISSERLGNRIQFGPRGETVEQRYNELHNMFIPLDCSIAPAPIIQVLCPNISSVPPARIAEFICIAYKMFEDLEFTFMEFNPVVFLPPDGCVAPLSMQAELDHASWFRNNKKWGDTDFPRVFGLHSPEEEYVTQLDALSSSSLKLHVINPRGRIWCIVAGAGASMVLADTIDHAGMIADLANFGEYAGNPDEEETYNFARTIIQLSTSNYDGRGRVLLVGGGIANFTDVSITFKGIAHAIREYQDGLKQVRARVYVRRAGPNYVPALKIMRELAAETGLQISVYGPELPMTAIVPMAVEYLKSMDAAAAAQPQAPTGPVQPGTTTSTSTSTTSSSSSGSTAATSTNSATNSATTTTTATGTGSSSASAATSTSTSPSIATATAATTTASASQANSSATSPSASPSTLASSTSMDYLSRFDGVAQNLQQSASALDYTSVFDGVKLCRPEAQPPSLSTSAPTPSSSSSSSALASSSSSSSARTSQEQQRAPPSLIKLPPPPIPLQIVELDTASLQSSLMQLPQQQQQQQQHQQQVQPPPRGYGSPSSSSSSSPYDSDDTPPMTPPPHDLNSVVLSEKQE
ncbi:ATP-citrate synthase [Pelomyxa schiedti]|nr:ATP-citrate synthase [Pelomyxa schiedti]